jgi:hypothetical protein
MINGISTIPIETLSFGPKKAPLGQKKVFALTPNSAIPCKVNLRTVVDCGISRILFKNFCEATFGNYRKNSIMAQEREFQFLPSSADETLERLVTMTNQTNLVALDKTLAAIRRASISYAASAARVGSIGERIVRAVHEVGMTLPPELRAI